MKYLLLFSLFLLPIFVFSQSISSLDLSSSMDYSYRTIRSNENSEEIRLLLKVRKEIEKAKLNWRIGGNVNWKVTESLFFKTGLRLASVGYIQTDNSDLQFPNQHDGNGGISPDPNPSGIERIKITSDHWFFEIPIIARYEFGLHQFIPYFEAGISPHLFLTTKTTTITNMDRSSEYSSANNRSERNNLQLVGIFSVGMNYNFTPSIQLFTQPTFRYHFTKFYEAPITENLYNVGLEIGLRKMF